MGCLWCQQVRRNITACYMLDMMSHSLVEFLLGKNQKSRDVKQSLVKYLGLLHCIEISYVALDCLYP